MEPKIRMKANRDVIEELSAYIQNPLLSISGESGLGKTTLAQQIIGSLLAKTGDTCIWVQASERFSKTRFKALFPTTYSERLGKVFIAPSYGVFQSSLEQAEFLRRLHREKMMLPPSTKYLVIDNISHHLRYEVLKGKDIESISQTLNRFFEECLSPLLFFCQTHFIFLVLIHESTYNPKEDRSEKFYNKLYSRLDSTEIILEKDNFSDKKVLTVMKNGSKKSYEYRITREGIVLST